MNALEIANWHRERAITLEQGAKAMMEEAKLHLQMANKLSPSNPAKGVQLSLPAQSNGYAPLTIENVREYLSKKGGRVVHLARHFGVSEGVMRALIESKDSGIVVKDRGWLRLAPKVIEVADEPDDFQQPR